MYVCFVKFKRRSKKEYLFDCTDINEKINIDSPVCCHVYPNAIDKEIVKLARTTSEPMYFKNTRDKNFIKLKAEHKATLPLAKLSLPVIQDNKWVKEKIPLSEIKVPAKFDTTELLQQKLEKCIAYYKLKGKFNEPIILDTDNDLIDGYTRFIAANILNLGEVDILRISFK